MFSNEAGGSRNISQTARFLLEALLESELFGLMKGSFTGAHKDKIGKFEAANGGTIFLDEIGTMPHQLQSKLLRVLQEQEIERIGSTPPVKIGLRRLESA